MNLSEAVAISASSLWAHKLRSVLTLIGVVIGVAAVIAVVSLINGANQYVATRVFRLGADVFGLSKQPSFITNVDEWLEFQKRKRLTYDGHVYHAVMTFIDNDHFRATWKFRKEQKDAFTEDMTYVRAK
jgi:putative ABC transport system permease protein